MQIIAELGSECNIVSPDLAEARQFTDLLDPAAHSWVFQTFDDVQLPDGTRRRDPSLTKTLHGSLDAVAGELASLNRRGAGIFVTVNAMRGAQRGTAHLERIRAIYADWDRGRAAMPRGAEPLIVTETSPGRFQALWLVDGLSAQEHAAFQKRLVQDYAADPNAVDVARVLRLPGFCHMKGAALGQSFLVRIVGGGARASYMLDEPPHRFTRAELQGVLPPIDAHTLPVTAATPREPPAFDADLLRSALMVVPSDDRETWLRVGAALHGASGGSEGGREVWTEWSAQSASFDPRDQDRVWRSFKRVDGALAGAETIYGLARQCGWVEPVAALFDDVSAEFSAVATAPQAKAPPKPIFEPATRWAGLEPQPSPFTIQTIAPRGFVTLLVSAGGRGKTLLAQQAMTCVAAGVPFLGFQVEQGSAAGIFTEDDDSELHRRQLTTCHDLGIDFDSIAGRVFPTSYVERDAVLWNASGPAPLLVEVAKAVAARPELKLLVIDNVAQVFAAVEYDRGIVTGFLKALTSLATKHALAILLLHHESKSSAGNDTHAASGSTAWINGARSVLKLDAVEGMPEMRNLVHIKSNRGPRAATTLLRFQGATLLAVAVPARAEACRAATLQKLTEAAASGQNLSPNSRAANHAPKALAKQIEFTVVEIGEALAALVRTGAIIVEAYTSNRVTCGRYRVDPDAAAVAADIANARHAPNELPELLS